MIILRVIHPQNYLNRDFFHLKGGIAWKKYSEFTEKDEVSIKRAFTLKYYNLLSCRKYNFYGRCSRTVKILRMNHIIKNIMSYSDYKFEK